MGQRARALGIAASVALAVACGGSGNDAFTTDEGPQPGDDAGSGSPSSSNDAGAHPDGGTTIGDSGSPGMPGSSDGGGGGGGSGGGGNDGGAPPPQHDGGAPGKVPVPKPVGACPTFQNGTVTFNPAEGARTVQLFLDPTKLSKHGPLVLYWYATYGSPAQASQALGSALQQIEALGGVVAAPQDNGTGQFPWLDAIPKHELLADEIVGCAAAAGVDTSRIHALGFSAGALMTTQLAFDRSSYLASVATYSGGLTSNMAPPYQDPSNKFAALILTGGTSDNVFNTDFQQASKNFQAKLKGDGHSALYCDHGGGHTIPSAYTAAVGQFFLDHPFGTNPSPYVGNLPTALKACTF